LASFLVIGLIATLNLVQYTYEFYSVDWAKTWPEGLTKMTFAYWFAIYISPFTYGALGACPHILRVREKHLRERTFGPRRIPQHRNRMVLGTLSGGAIVLFVTIGEGSDSTLKLTVAAMGFLAGYSIDFLFVILDRILNAIVPSNKEQVVTERLNTQIVKDMSASGEKATQSVQEPPVSRSAVVVGNIGAGKAD
jgi:hypothetical protein